MPLPVKRFLLLKADLLARLIAVLCLLVLLWFGSRLLPSLSGLWEVLGVRIDIAEKVLTGFLVAATFAFLVRPPGLQWLLRWARHTLLPVNTHFRETHLTAFTRYHAALSGRIQNLLPSELAEIWDMPQGLTSRANNSRMICLQAEEAVSFSTNTRPTRIDDILDFLEVELFLRAKDHSPPVTLQGEPGSGKSTVFFELYRRQALRLLTDRHGWFPLLVFAHEISWDLIRDQATLKHFLVRYFEESATRPVSPELADVTRQAYLDLAALLRDAYQRYQFLIIIDGLDEIPNRPLYEQISRKLNELLEHDWKTPPPGATINRYVVSCRVDDNQRIITSRLISLLPLQYEAILGHLRALQRSYRKTDPSGQRKVAILLQRLERRKATRLLDNYIRNPYLLSLILEYYRDVDDPPASRLNQVFEHVLERELAKPRSEFEGANSIAARVALRGYLSSLLAPYCFRRIMDTLFEDGAAERDFGAYIREDERLGTILFGHATTAGYLRSVYDNLSSAREDSFQALATLWGEAKTRHFREFLEHRLKTRPAFDAFEAAAITYLHQDMLQLLGQANLVEVDRSTGSIRRFRHRRMQDYFMALYLERVGVVRAGVPLDNAWMREPLRILAAISPRSADLLSAFVQAHDSTVAAPIEAPIEYLNGVANLLLNASESVAYLPRAIAKVSDAPLRSVVVQLGVRAEELYRRASTRQQHTPERRREIVGWLTLQDKCLTILRNVYASEFLSSEKALFTTSLMRLSHASNWRAIHAHILRQPDAFQHIAYTHLYPIKRNHRTLPLWHASLFVYVVEAVVCFWAAYRRLITHTHPERLTRALPWLLAASEKALALLVIAGVVYVALDPRHADESGIIKGLRLAIAAGIGFLLAWMAQLAGRMPWAEAQHFPAWLLLRFVKQLWAWGGTLATIVPTRVTLVRVTTQMIRAAVHLVQEQAFRRLIRFTGVIAVLTLMFVGIRYTIWPAVVDWSRKIETAANSREFLARAEMFRSDYAKLPLDLGPVDRFNDPERDPERLDQLVNVLEGPARALDDLVTQGSRLTEPARVHRLAELVAVEREVTQLAKEQTRLAAVRDSLLRQAGFLRYESQAARFVRAATARLREADQIERRGKPSAAPKDRLQELTKLNQALQALLDSAKPLTSSNQYHSTGYRSEIAKVARRATETLARTQPEAALLTKSIADEAAAQTTVAQAGSASASADLQPPQTPSAPKVPAPKPTKPSSAQPVPSAVPDPNQHRRQMLQRISEELLGVSLGERDRESFVLSEGLLNERHRLEAIRRRLQPRSAGSWTAFLERGLENIAEIERGRIASELKYAKDLLATHVGLEPLAAHLASYEQELNETLRQLRDFEDLRSWTLRLQERMSEVKDHQRKISSFRALVPQSEARQLIGELERSLREAGERASWQLSIAAMSFLTLAPLLGLYRLWLSFGDRAGRRRVESIRQSYDSLLEFLRENRHSLDVNEQAVGYLRQVAPIRPQTYKQISDVMERRLRTPGELNERIGLLLREVAAGIDNILNRQLPEPSPYPKT